MGPATRLRLSPKLIQILALSALFGAAACDFHYEKGRPSDAPPETFSQDGPVGYDRINAEILVPKCLKCHSTRDPILRTYDQVVENSQKIWETVVDRRTMPKRGTLDPSLIAMLRDWIQSGMPKDGGAPAPTADSPRNPAPLPAPIPSGINSSGIGAIPRPYTFANLKADVLERKCNECHYSGNATDLPPFETYRDFLEKADGTRFRVFGLWGDGRPVSEDDVMPPEEAPALTDGDKARLLLWYSDGKRDGTEAPKPLPPGRPGSSGGGA